VERANAGDVDGLVALYEPDAVLTFPAGHIAHGGQAIRAVYEKLLAGRPTLAPGEQQPALVNGDLALTSTRLAGGGVTVEVGDDGGLAGAPGSGSLLVRSLPSPQ
jgi:ketosteroid isomerase-like protein